MHGLAIDSGNNVTTNEACFVGWRARGLNIVKGHSTISRVKRVHACIRTGRNSLPDFFNDVLADRLDDGCEPAGGDKENEQADKHPAHTGHATPTFPNTPPRG